VVVAREAERVFMFAANQSQTDLIALVVLAPETRLVVAVVQL
jgi:hypothetical protein